MRRGRAGTGSLNASGARAKWQLDESAPRYFSGVNVRCVQDLSHDASRQPAHLNIA